VGAVVVEVGYVLGQHVRKVAAVDDQYPVKQLSAYGADPTFGDSIRARRAYRCVQDTDVFPDKGSVEGIGELAVSIPDQKLERCRTVAQAAPPLFADPIGPRIVSLTGHKIYPNGFGLLRYGWWR
jgi:hypothetical protein